MEKKVFIRPAVAGRLQQGFVEARLHNDGDHKVRIKAMQQEMTGSLATPVYLVLDPETGEVLARQYGPTLSSDQPFIDFLEAGLAAART